MTCFSRPASRAIKLGIVVHRAHTLGYLDQRLFRRSGGFRLRCRNPFDGREQALQDFVLIRADGQLHLDFIGDDVVLGAAVDRAHGNNGRILGIVFPGHDGLPAHNGPRRQHNRIDRGLRARPVPADTVNGDVHRVRVRRAEAGRVVDFSGWKLVGVVDGKRKVRFGKAGEQAVFHHGSSPADTLLGGLTDIDKSAVPAVFIPRQQCSGSDADGHVQVVPTGMHHRNFNAAVVVGGDVACVGEAGFLRDRQRIEFGAQHDRGSRSVLQDADHACAPDSGGHVVSKLAQLRRDHGCGLLLVIGEFGAAVQVEIKRFDLGVVASICWLEGARHGSAAQAITENMKSDNKQRGTIGFFTSPEKG